MGRRRDQINIHAYVLEGGNRPVLFEDTVGTEHAAPGQPWHEHADKVRLGGGQAGAGNGVDNTGRRGGGEVRECRWQDEGLRAAVLLQQLHGNHGSGLWSQQPAAGDATAAAVCKNVSPADLLHVGCTGMPRMSEPHS